MSKAISENRKLQIETRDFLKKTQADGKLIRVTGHWSGDFTGAPVEINDTFATFTRDGGGQEVMYGHATFSEVANG